LTVPAAVSAVGDGGFGSEFIGYVPGMGGRWRDSNFKKSGVYKDGMEAMHGKGDRPCLSILVVFSSPPSIQH
jgi:hypothetical protein